MSDPLLAKLQAALLAKSKVEKELLMDLAKVRDIHKQREAVFEELKLEEFKFLEQIQVLNSDHKIPALLKGEVSSAAGVQVVFNLIIEKLDLCRKKLENAYAELQRAMDREEQIKLTISQIKTEQKQIEKFIENRNLLSQSIKEAADEVSIEEILKQK